MRNAAAAATFAHILIARRVLSARSITSTHRFHAPASSRDASRARAPVTFCDTTTYSAHWFHAPASSRRISRARAPSSLARFSRSCSTTPTHLRNAAAAATFAHIRTACCVFRVSSTESIHWFHAALSSREARRFSAPSNLSRFSCSWASAAFQAAKAQARVPSDHMLTALFVFRASSQYSVHRFQFFASSLWMIRSRNAFPFSSMARWRTACATARRHTPNLYFFVLRM